MKFSPKSLIAVSAINLAISFAQMTLANAEETYPQSQGWTQVEMRQWYGLSQGSRLAPLHWLKALKAENGTPFFTRANLEKFGYLYFPNQTSELPVGFVLDITTGNPYPWLGLNCSACHTSQLKTDKAEVWVHGGQTMADFQGFVTAVVNGLSTVGSDPAAFAEFSISVLGAQASADEQAKLKNELREWLAFRGPITKSGADSHWGRGRADAVGVILATTAMVVADPHIAPAAREPLPASNAPVSYPFVWNANQQARLQHNGVVDNGTNLGLFKVVKIGALIRNWTEALGVFADVKLDGDANKVNSSIRLDNLLLLEQALADLQSPVWPTAFGALDTKRQARGQAVFKANCGGCHGLLDHADTKTNLPLLSQPSKQDPNDPRGFIYLQPVFDKTSRPSAFLKTHQPSPDFIGTDPSMACNALLHQVPSGRFEGQVNVAGIVPSFADRKFSDRAVTTDLLRVLMQRDVLANRTRSLMSIGENQIAAAGGVITRYAYGVVESFTGQDVGQDPLAPLRAQLQFCAAMADAARARAPDSPLPVYKARPLNGIWATAPYLHNGSVPTLYDLLLPQKQRPKSFGYYDGLMDTQKGGLRDASQNPKAFIFRTYDAQGYVIPGNWNGGHEYGTTLSRAQKRDLVEYLKGL
jgi:hypothetical protein